MKKKLKPKIEAVKAWGAILPNGILAGFAEYTPEDVYFVGDEGVKATRVVILRLSDFRKLVRVAK